MDTMLLWPEKRVLNAIGIGVTIAVIGGFTLTQSIFMPILASDILAAVSNPVMDTGQVAMQIMNEVSAEARARSFDERIAEKYPKAAIYDIDKGIKHIKLTQYYDGKPVKINVVEVNSKLARDYTLAPALASGTLASKQTISNIARDTNSIIALNGTFFKPQTGVPLGTLMINGKMYTGPVYDRVAMGIFDNGYDIARVQLNAVLRTDSGNIKVDNLNQPRMLATYVLAYTPEWGSVAPPTPKYGLQIAVEHDRIIRISENSLPIPGDGYVIAGPASSFLGLKEGDRVRLDVKTTPEWKNVRHIISGGPYLVKDSEIFVDMTAEKLASIGGKNPRSAIGYTADNNLVFVAVDGREGSSAGMTLIQLANFMKSAGCVNAMNLDGGGSTVMYVNGQVVNSPQAQGGIPISNAVVLSRKG